MDGDAHFHNQLQTYCSKFKFTSPRPKVYKFCKDAFQEGVMNACHHACNELGHGTSKIEHFSGQFCKKFRQELPKPKIYNSCEIGYKAGGAAGSDFATRKRSEWEAKRAAGESPEQAATEMEEEATLEEKITQELPEEVTIDETRLHDEALKIEKKVHQRNVTAPVSDVDLAREAAKAAFAMQTDSDNTYEIDF